MFSHGLRQPLGKACSTPAGVVALRLRTIALVISWEPLPHMCTPPLLHSLLVYNWSEWLLIQSRQIDRPLMWYYILVAPSQPPSRLLWTCQVSGWVGYVCSALLVPLGIAPCWLTSFRASYVSIVLFLDTPAPSQHNSPKQRGLHMGTRWCAVESSKLHPILPSPGQWCVKLICVVLSILTDFYLPMYKGIFKYTQDKYNYIIS